MFGRTASPALDLDDPHLEVTVTPSQSAFYAGEVFSAVITLRNTRTPVRTAQSQPASPNPQHLHLLSSAKSPSPNGSISPASPSPSRTPGTPTGYNDWRGHARKPSHGRRSQSLALGKGISPQEILWALGGETAQSTPQIGPPPLPTRRAGGIPQAHPHARKISVASTAAFNSPPVPITPLPLHDDSPLDERFSFSSDADAGPSRPSSARATPRASPALHDVAEEQLASPPPPHLINPNPLSRRSSARTPSPISPHDPSAHSTPSPGSPLESPRPSPVRPAHRRAPSYQNAYGASLLTPPPAHPMRRPAVQTGVTTILWGHTRLVARFAPSHAYIPPDPLLPLRARLLHQPIGSGSLAPQQAEKASRWSLSFGTGTIGEATQPSLTGSLFGLAKGLVYGGTGGSLEEERKRVWTTQDLPVFETTRSLMGVDIKLQEGETREFVYTLQLPATLPPAFKGKALRFSYELVLSLNVALPGGGKRQRSKEIIVPVRVWPNVSLHHMLRTYDVLQPIIQTSESGSVEERNPTPTTTPRRPQHMYEPPQSIDSLAAYAKRLVDSVEEHKAPPSPSKTFRPLSPQKSRSPKSTRPRPSLLLEAPGRPRSLSVSVVGDDELVDVDDEAQRCGEAVEILSRHSPKASYDIRQEGEVVAVLTLVKTTYRLGETVTGVVTFNSHPDRRVLKLNAYLETHEVIPEPLLPPSSSLGRRQPELRRLHAEQRTAYGQFTARTAFSLDIPSDATPAFTLAAGDGSNGGLQWRVRLAFLVASPPRRKSGDGRRRSSGRAEESAREQRRSQSPEKIPEEKSSSKRRNDSECLHLIPVDGDADNTPYTAAPSLVPFIATREGWAEARAETVECEVPVQVLAGNTAFVVRPSVFTV